MIKKNQNTKIIFIFDNSDIGGSQKLTSDIINNLKNDNPDISLLILFGSENKCNINIKNIKYLGLSDYNFIENLRIIYNHVRDYDIVISSMCEGNLYVSILKYFKIIKSHSISITHGRDSYFIDDKNLKIKLKELNILYKIKIKYLLNIFLRNIDKFICVSNDLKEYLMEFRYVNENKIYVQHFGQNIKHLSRYEYINLLFKTRYQNFIIMYTGRVTYAKGLEDLLESMKILKDVIPNILCLIIGEGELKTNLTKKIRKYNLYDNVIILPFTEDILKYISICHIYILLSSYESTNIGIQQAMYLKKIVLSSNAGGINDLISNGENGFIYNKNNLAEFIERIKWIYDNYDSIYKTIGSNAKNKIENEFNLANNMKYIKNIIFN